MRAGAVIALALAPLLLAATGPPPPTPTPLPAPALAGGREVVLLTIDGSINPATVSYLAHGIESAQARGAAAVVVELDTPGGLLESAKSMVKEILGAPLPIIVYVAPSGGSATSAGVFVTLAAQVAAMAPGTTIGAAHPVGPGGGDIGGDIGAKVENAVASMSRSIAEQRGRNVEWAEKAVRESVSVTEREAVTLKIVDLVADNLDDLLAKVATREVEVQGRTQRLDTAGAVVVPFAMGIGERILGLVADPNIAYLLLLAGVLGLYVEFTHPGVLFPGVAGAICLLLAAAALQVLSINWTGLGLIGLGAAMLIAEVFLPSFGVVGVGGLVAFVLGSLLLFDTPGSTLEVDRGLIAGAAVTLGGFALIVGWLVVRAQRRPAAVGAEAMLGETAEVRRVLAGGRVKVFVRGEYWEAVADETVAVGEAVEVMAVDGLRLRVRRRRRAEEGE